MLKRFTMLLFLCMLAFGIVGCGGSSVSTTDTTTSSNAGTPTVSTTASSVASPTASPLHVSSLSIVSNPNTLSQVSCNSTTNITFSATINVDAGSSGGTVAYTWTANGASTSDHVLFAPGQTSKTITYALNNTYIQYNATNTGVNFSVTSPNSISTLSKPVGNCTYTGPFVVTGIGLGAYPTSVAGIACGTSISVTYTATIYIAANSNGGTVALTWTFDHLSKVASAVFAPGTTTQTTSYTLAGKLVRNGLGFPRPVLINSTSPNILYSNYAVPAGSCI